MGTIPPPIATPAPHTSLRSARFRLFVLCTMVLATFLCVHTTVAQPDTRTYIYAPSPDWEPLDYFNFRDEHTGILADFVTRMELQTGLQIQRIQLNTWTEILDSLQTGGAHLSIGIHPTPARETYLNFTDPFLTIPMVILTRRSAPIRTKTELNNSTVAVVRNYASTEYLMQTLPDATWIPVEDELSAMIQTAYGQADAMMTDVLTAGYLIRRYGIQNLVLGPESDFEWKLAIGVVKSEPELFDVLSSYVDALPDDYDQMLLRSPMEITLSEAPGFWELHYKLVIGAFALIIVALAMFLGLNRRLNQLVKRQVGEIEQQNEKLREIAWLQSHELRGPLCLMSTILINLKDHEGCDGETREMLSHIEQSIHEIDTVIHTIVRKTDRLDLE